MTCPRISSIAGGEFEIEKVPVQEIEVTEKELLPCFDHCLSLKSDCNDRRVQVISFNILQNNSCIIWVS